MRRRYRDRRDALVKRLAGCAPEMAVQGISAGLHAVISLPADRAETAALQLARRRNVALTGLGPFWHGAGSRSAGIVVGYGTPPEHEYAGALDHLGQLMRAVTSCW